MIVLSERRHFDLHTDNSVSSKTSAFNITAYAVSRLRGDANSAQAVMLNLAIFTVGRNLNVKKHFFFGCCWTERFCLPTVFGKKMWRAIMSNSFGHFMSPRSSDIALSGLLLLLHLLLKQLRGDVVHSRRLYCFQTTQNLRCNIFLRNG